MAGFTLNSLSKDGGSEYPKPKVAAQEGRILRVIDRGIRKPKNPKFKPRRQLQITVELSEDKIVIEEDGKKVEKPMVASLFVNVAGKGQGGKHSKFTQLVSDILDVGDNDPFTLEDFLGKAVGVKLGKDDDGTLNGFIDTLSPLSKRVQDTVPPLVADSYAFDFTDPDPSVLKDKLSETMQNKLKEALNYPGSAVQTILEGTHPEDEEEIETKDVM